MNNEEKLDFIKEISGFSGKGRPSGERDAIEAVKELRKRYDAEYKRNRDKSMNNGAEILFVEYELKKVKEELRCIKNSYFLLKRKFKKLTKLKNP
tara:strand:- start:481 stop:765 length:285 start_codon:yes stop_codon:yes gene_type:complete